MTKRVRYNGGTESYYGCSDPSNLIVGKEYEVLSENDRGFQTDYTLKGVDGNFNSVWFNDVEDGVYMAVSRTKPVIGEKYIVYRIDFVNGYPKLEKWPTSTVISISYFGENIYKVTTRNSTYFVQVRN